jgi:hypothetical protein
MGAAILDDAHETAEQAVLWPPIRTPPQPGPPARAEYLLDRRATESRIGDYAPSSLVGLLRLIERLTLEDELREIETEPDTSHLRDRNDGLWTRRYYRAALGYGLKVCAEPLTALAMVLLIDRSDDRATVLGTPLYVAFHVPR